MAMPVVKCDYFMHLEQLLTDFWIGWSIKSYRDNDPIPLFVNKVYSDHTQLQYAFYDLPFVSTFMAAMSRIITDHLANSCSNRYAHPLVARTQDRIS